MLAVKVQADRAPQAIDQVAVATLNHQVNKYSSGH